MSVTSPIFPFSVNTLKGQKIGNNCIKGEILRALSAADTGVELRDNGGDMIPANSSLLCKALNDKQISHLQAGNCIRMINVSLGTGAC